MKITVQTQVHAHIDDVWHFYTDPDAIKAWNAASGDWHTPKATSDLRVGGNFCYRMEAKDGSAGFDFAGTFTEIVEPLRLEYQFADRHVRVEFSDTLEGVQVKVTFDAETEHSPEQQQQGWQAILDNFKQYVEAHILA